MYLKSQIAMYHILFSFCFFMLVTSSLLFGQTIAEKKAGLVSGGNDLNQDVHLFLTQVNKEFIEYQATLKKLYAQVAELYSQNAPPESYKNLLDKIEQIREDISALEASWRGIVTETSHDEAYALWHQPETTIGQLIMDYGSHDYVYLFTPEVGSIQLSVDSNLPIPRANWTEMLDLILTQNGVGVKQLNPYLRQLYLINQDRSSVRLVTNNRKELDLFSPDTRVAFVLSPEPSDVRRVWTFLEKFVNPNTAVLQTVGRDILIIAPIADILDMLKLYDFVSANRGDKEYKIVTLSAIDGEEMARILNVIFDQFIDSTSAPSLREFEHPGVAESPENRLKRAKTAPPIKKNEETNVSGLKVISLTHIARALFLVGTKEEIQKAEQIIREVESQVGEARDRIIYWYTTKHSDPEELAEVLAKIYQLMVTTGAVGEEQAKAVCETPPAPPPLEVPLLPYPSTKVFDEGYYLDNRYIVNNSPTQEYRGRSNADINNRSNFIVDLKSGAIVMVVEADILPKMKELIKKLDVPKKMVQIEVMLFEKRVDKDNNFGLNLLKLGDAAAQVTTAGLRFNDIASNVLNAGITEFFFSHKRTCSGIPAYDAAYKFLLSQTDVQINASPSILTVNQVPAHIAIEEEISVSTGIFEIPTTGAVALKDAFARARYGIKIDITPTIHMRDEDDFDDDNPHYVTLDTDIAFETIQPGSNPQRPDVTRRVVNNTVRIPDGQTVIIGGLRRKTTTESKDSIPYLGELPGIGVLFSNTDIKENSTEMFIFITPKIIVDPEEELLWLRTQEMCRRPGDIPCFLCNLVAARELEKKRLLEGTLTIMLGPAPDRCYPAPEGEYDGR